MSNETFISYEELLMEQQLEIWRKKMRRIFFAGIGAMLVQTLIDPSLYADQGPRQFFERNAAKCFYCADSSTEVTNAPALMGPQVSDPNTAEVLPAAASKRAPMPTDYNLRVDEKAPEPFKNLVAAYEAGDMKSAYVQARAWVKYQQKLIDRSKALAAMIEKAQEDIEENGDGESQDLRSLLPAPSDKRYEIVYVFDLFSRSAERASQAVQELYEAALTNRSLNIRAITTTASSDEDRALYGQQLGFTVPITSNPETTQRLGLTQTPAMLVLDQRGTVLCRYQEHFAAEMLVEFVRGCVGGK